MAAAPATEKKDRAQGTQETQRNETIADSDCISTHLRIDGGDSLASFRVAERFLAERTKPPGGLHQLATARTGRGIGPGSVRREGRTAPWGGRHGTDHHPRILDLLQAPRTSQPGVLEGVRDL